MAQVRQLKKNKDQLLSPSIHKRNENSVNQNRYRLVVNQSCLKFFKSMAFEIFTKNVK